MTSKKDTKKRDGRGIREDRPVFPEGHHYVGKDVPDEIKDYLIQKLDKDFPVKIIERISKGLRSRDSKVFLDTLKTVLKQIPEPVAPIATSPVVQALIDKHLESVMEGLELIEDRSTVKAREEDREDKLKDK